MVFTVAFALCLVVVGRLVYLQVVRYDHYSALAREEHWREEDVPARRGAILDNEGNVLATSIDYDSLYAYPQQVKDPDRIAALLSPVVNEPIEALAEKLKLKQGAPVLLKRWLSPEAADQVREMARKPEFADAYVYLKPEPKRVYPEGSVAPDVIGFLGADGKGLAGLEYSLDDEVDANLPGLAGKPGHLVAERDTEGQTIQVGNPAWKYDPPVDGVHVQLTLDRQLQRIVERECDASVKEWLADACTGIIMDPKTSAILAMGGSPRFDLTDPDLLDKPAAVFRNRAIQESWEPGSVFKAVTMACGIDAGAVTPDGKLNDSGALSAFGITVHNWNMTGPGLTDFTDGLARSSNVVLGTVAMRLGEEKFYDCVRRFGFGRPTGIRFPGEATGLLGDPGAPDWYKGNLITNAFGQGIAATPLQMITAAAAIANGGTLNRPYLVQGVYDSKGRLMREHQPEGVRVISPATATDVRTMMKAVVDRSPTKPAVIQGYDVAGKSGTAEIPTATGYSKETEATFIAFLPYDDPQLVFLVRLTRPRKNEWSETVAAPTLRKIAVQAIAREKLMPRDAAVVDVGRPSGRVVVTDTVAVAQTPVSAPTPARAVVPATTSAPAANNVTASSGAAAPPRPAAPSSAAPATGGGSTVRQPTATPRPAAPATGSGGQAAPANVPAPTATRVPAAPSNSAPAVQPTAARQVAPPPTTVPAPVIQPTARPAVVATPAGAPALPPPVNPATAPAPARPAAQPTAARPIVVPTAAGGR